MAEDANTGENKDANTGENKDASTAAIAKKKNRSKGFISKIWNGLFRLHGDDFEKRLQHISKEEAAVLARMQRRASSWRKMARNLIVLSVLFEGIAVCYAILTTRSLDLDWKMRAFRVLPMFLLPALSTLTYSAYGSFIRICDRKDQKTLERLRAERQAKINELKEKTNYYSTQQLIQRYDTDPAAKAAAATVLASKLGADSGLKLFMEDNTKPNFSTGKSNDVEPMQSTGLRKRKQLSSTPSGSESTISHQSKVGALHDPAAEIHASSSHNSPPVVEHYSQGGTMHDGGWLARIAALLVGEDPTQSYALICGNCHRHNGLARKEDFPYITYYCPHCSALNRSKQMEGSTPPALIESTSHKTSPPSAASPEAASPVEDLTTLTSTASEIAAQESREERPATEIPET